MKLIELLATPQLCPRCYTGIDDDGDGNCAFCAGATDKAVAAFRIERLRSIAQMDRQIIRLHEESAVEAWQLKIRETARADKLQTKIHDIHGEIVEVIDSIPPEYRVRVREGAGPENLFASLAVSTAKMISEHLYLKRRFT